jgi:hypothetical protein
MISHNTLTDIRESTKLVETTRRSSSICWQARPKLRGSPYSKPRKNFYATIDHLSSLDVRGRLKKWRRRSSFSHQSPPRLSPGPICALMAVQLPVDKAEIFQERSAS